jgi:quinol monooxygenase YgiN
MIVLSATFHAKPGCEAQLEAALRTMILPTGREKGTLEYVLHRAKDDSAHFFFYEKYRDQAALELHSSGAALKTLLETVPDLCASAPVVIAFEPIVSIHD